MINFLQISGPQLNEAVDQLTQTSIQIAQAVSDYGALKVVFSIFIVFMIIIMILFVYQVISLNNKVSEISVAAEKTQRYFEGASDHTVGVTQSNIIIRRCLNSLSQSIKYYILRVRLENHISDEAETKEKIHRLVKNEYTELSTFLGSIYCQDQPLSALLKEDDYLLIEELMTAQVYIPQETFSVSSMAQTVNLFINGLKLDYLQKL